jgi:hypothetical protein
MSETFLSVNFPEKRRHAQGLLQWSQCRSQNSWPNRPPSPPAPPPGHSIGDPAMDRFLGARRGHPRFIEPFSHLKIGGLGKSRDDMLGADVLVMESRGLVGGRSQDS